ncbi:FAD/NAD(P)-binding domain-containing protein [Teratosphaeria nubilosa]|uniref:FAD/NAD(P)-binding domain-containing protein n=1 Tax=Teratosphaeria nubilosa TaxID=161662 RepID=A0A6G1L2S9_9PEZI|nr:FAD/NAD(P)-binding domain-containing protein [Teratosphaeria nubilosa]
MSVFNHQINGDVNGTRSLIKDDDVRVAPPSGINVLIVGAGACGLTAALECHRKGHNVRILERSASASAGGDMFTIMRSARVWMNHYPEMKAEFDRISVHNGWMQYRKHTGEVIGEPKPFAQMVGGGQLSPDNQPMVTQLRPLYHAMLYHQIERFGISVAYNMKVTEYYEDNERGVGGVILESGEKAEADRIIAADGLGSKSQSLVLGGKSKGRSSGRSIFRAAWPLEMAMADPVVKEVFGLRDGKYPLMQGWLGPDTHTMCLSYVDREGQNGLMCWGLTFTEPDGPEAQSTVESWRNAVRAEDVLQTMARIPGWNDAMVRLVKTMPEGSIIYWPLLWRNPNPCTHSPSGRVLQIGDAAHSFLPTSGNGATQAIEDAVTIAAALVHAGKDHVEVAVKTYGLLRSDRVSIAQLLGFYNAEVYHKNDAAKSSGDSSKVAAKVPKWIWQFDPEKYADANYDRAAASVEGGEKFTNTNIPPGYTPMPWTLEGIEQLYKEGKTIELTGDWS